MARAAMHRRHLRQLRRGGHWSFRPVVFSLIAVSAVAIVAMAALAGFILLGIGVPTPAEAIANRGGGARIYDRNGKLLYQFLNPQTGLQRSVKLDQVSPWVVKATIATEDPTFYSNPGINFRGLARAVVQNLTPGDTFLHGSGGSSITQQLVKRLYFSQQQRDSRSVSRKLIEIPLSIAITQEYDKSQILSWYLNEIPYGSNFTGIEAASEGYFGVHAKDLTLGEAALLVGLPQSPSEYDPFLHMDAALTRQHEVLDLMAEHGVISQQDANWAKLEKIQLHPAGDPMLAPHFVQYVADYISRTLGPDALYNGGLRVVTTLDLNLNNEANAILDQQIAAHEAATNAHNGAVVIIDPKNGQILAMVGSRDYARADIDGAVNDSIALRSPGSTLKPFTYATAFMEGWGPNWPIVDSPITWSAPGTTPLSPVNPDFRFHGIIPARVALGNSFNVPAFKTILWAGVDNVINTAKAMGVTTLDGHQLGPALTLGGSDVKLLDLVYAYSALANGGTMAGVPTTAALPVGNRSLDPVPVLYVTDASGRILLNNTQSQTVSAMAPQYAWMISDILSRDANRLVTYGTGSVLDIPGWQVAAKTGASQPYVNSDLTGDTWTVGYTSDVAVGVWAGNSDYQPMHSILSTTIAGAAWHDIMVKALAGYQPHGFVEPPGIVTATVCVPSGIVRPAGSHCPSVTGPFAADALARQDGSWWGGIEMPSPESAQARIAGIPASVTGWQRYLAEEYVRALAPPPPAPTPLPSPARGLVPAPSPVATPPPAPASPARTPRPAGARG